MANIENYLFNVDADVSSAIKKLQEINKYMNQIERTVNKANDDYSTTTQKDMDKSMRSMAAITKTKRELERELEDLKRLMQDTASSFSIPDNATDDQIKSIEKLRDSYKQAFSEIEEQEKELQRSFEDTRKLMRQLSDMQQNYSRNFTNIFNSKDTRNLPDDLERALKITKMLASESDKSSRSLNQVLSRIKEVNQLDRRSESLSRRAAASGYMSHQQAKSFYQDYQTVGRDYHTALEDNMNELAQKGMERDRLTKRIREIERKAEPTRTEIDEKIAHQESIRAIDEEWEARMELNRVLERTIENMQKYNDAVLNANTEVKPERGTFLGMMYERAPAIGLALMGGVTAAMGSLFQRGSTIEQRMRPDVVSIGQRTDTDVGGYGFFGGKGWREGIRDNAFELGLDNRLGFTGQEMLAFQENYMSNAGYHGMDDLNTAAQEQAIFSRVSGMDSDTTRQFFESIYGTGAVRGNQTRDIQNAFIGAIKNSGMEGREKDQIDALQGILESVKSGREMTNAEVMNVMGLQSLLAQSGSRALRGEQGGRFLTDLNEGIRGGFDDPMMRMIFGQGTEYQGLEGRWELRKQMEKGISDVDNVNRLIGYARAVGGGNQVKENEVLASLFDYMGVENSAEQAEGIFDLARQGKLTQDSLTGVLESDKAVGEMTAEERMRNYQNSAEATANQSEAVTEKQAVQMTDFADGLRAANTAMAGFPPAIYAATVALAAFAATAGLSGAGFWLSRGVRKGAAGEYGRNMSWVDRAKNAFGGMFGGWFGGGGGKGGGGRTPTPPGGAPNANKLGGTTPPPIVGPDGKPISSETPDGGKKGGGWKNILGKGGGILNRILLPLSILTGASSILSAPEGQKGEATGNVVGGLGGAWAGMKGGAALGSFFGPWGTAIGGILGGIGGGIAGSSIGQWFGGLFGGNKAEAAELTSEDKEKLQKQLEQGILNTSTDENKLNQQVDRETANTKERTEDKKSDNLSYERENLHTYELLLLKAESLLHQARLQGGIFGDPNGGMGTMNTSFTPGEGGINYIAGGGQWTNTDLRKHDLKSHDPSVTADDLNAWINSKAPDGSVMRNMGEVFMQAAQSSGLDPRYLVAHAAHETAWGTSRIAKEKGNMYGIGAFDASPYASAYGYNNVQAGIIEGANWIAKNYYGRGQTTLETMRHNGGKHEYATDPLWDEKIAAIMKGAPKGSGDVNVQSTVNVTVNANGDENIVQQVSNSSAWKTVAADLQKKVYGSMNFYSKEMRTV